MRIPRRQTLAVLLGLGATATGCRQSSGAPGASPGSTGTPAPIRISYAEGPSQFGDLYLPERSKPSGTIVVLHGGFWQSTYGLDLGTTLAMNLAQRGYVAWNLEYRRLGEDGGGWPGTFADVATGIDHLQTLAETHPIPVRDVVTLGHSSGGHLAVWAASRSTIPSGQPGARPRVNPIGAISQAGVSDLATAALHGTGGDAVQTLLGGEPDAQAARYKIASPIELLPIAVPVRCIHTTEDTVVPIEQSELYVHAADAVGDDATLTTAPGDHFSHLDTGSPAWTKAITAISELL